MKLVPCVVRQQDILQQLFVWPVHCYIHQQFQMIFWIRNDTVISIYALICLLLGGIDGNQLRKGVHRPLLNIHCSSQPSMVHWLSSSIFPCSVGCLFVRLSRYGNTRPNLTSSCPQGGIKCGNRGTGFLDSDGSHR